MNLLIYYSRYIKERTKKLEYFEHNNYDSLTRIPKYNEYAENDLRKKFIDEYKKIVKRKLKVRIFNISFYSWPSENILAVHIYLENLSPEEIGIKRGTLINKNHDLVKIFCKILRKYKLPGINKNTRIDFSAIDYLGAYTIRKCLEVKEELDKKEKTYVETIMDGFVVGLEDEKYNQYINDEKYLKKNRNMLIKRLKKLDTENRIDLNKILVYIVPLSIWLEKACDKRETEKYLENAKKIEPTTDENEGRTMIDYNPINERRFYRSYVFLSKAMLLLFIISLILDGLIKLLFLGLLLPIYVIISAIFFFAYLKTSKIFSIIIVGLLLLFSVSNYKYVLDTKIFFEGKASVEIGIWEELSSDSYGYIMIKNKPVRNYYIIGKINDKIFKTKEKLTNGEKYEVKYLPNTNLVLQVTSYTFNVEDPS